MAGHSNRRIKSDRLLAEKIWGLSPNSGRILGTVPKFSMHNPG